MASVFQTNYSQRPSEAVPGMLSDAFRAVSRSQRVARGLIKAGYGLFMPALGQAGLANAQNPGEAFHIPTPSAAADVAAIKTTFASVVAPTTYSGTALNGTVGGREMRPPRRVTIVLSNNANWSAGNITFTGINHLGQLVSETLALPSSGNTTLTPVGSYMQVISVAFPAAGGTGGSATMGVAALASLTLADFLGVAIRKPTKTTLTAAGIYGYPGYTAETQEASYVDGEVISVLETGNIWVFTEQACVDRGDVYVRVTAGSGGSVIGAFRNDADSASAVLVTGAKFRRNCAAGVGLVRFG